MMPNYVTVVAGTPKILLLNNNSSVFNVTVRAAAGQTIEVALEDIPDKVTAPTSPGPTWVLAVASPIGANFYTFVNPFRLMRITGAGVATILQQGIL